MKFNYLYFSAIFLVITSCSSDTEKFEGVWQSVNDPSKQIIITGTGSTFSFETRNIESTLEGTPGTYNKEAHALEFVSDKGDTTQLVYNDSDKHLVGLGESFEKTTNAAVENKTETAPEEVPAEATPAENTQVSDNATNCDKGNILVITGNNVRVRNEPDLTKQNILFQVHKNYEVVHLGDKTVDGQKWYKVCYDGNIGWVSGQYASKK
jgi:Bacterial SH3 domain